MNITLRSVYKDGHKGVLALYQLLRERSTENDPHVNISHRALPPYREHLAFVRSRPYRAWFFVKVDGLIAGYVNVTRRNEIGIILSADYRGKGIGKQALQMLLTRTKPMAAKPSERSPGFLSNINPKNARSIALFTSLGFKHIQNTYEL